MMTGQERYDLVNSKHKCPVCGEYILALHGNLGDE